MAAHPEFIAELLHRFSRKVTTRKVLEVTLAHYEGPVFDLETESSMYFVGSGAVSSNCMCAVVEVL
jgi:purine nucleoside phosphorylase